MMGGLLLLYTFPQLGHLQIRGRAMNMPSGVLSCKEIAQRQFTSHDATELGHKLTGAT